MSKNKKEKSIQVANEAASGPAINPSQHSEIAQGVSIFQAPSLRIWRNSRQGKKRGFKKNY